MEKIKFTCNPGNRVCVKLSEAESAKNTEMVAFTNNDLYGKQLSPLAIRETGGVLS
jgi:hypothetical protein